MTIDEAIEQLKNLEKCEAYLWSKDIQAIDIAVNALQENKELKRLIKLEIESFDYIDKKFGCAGCHKGWEKCPYNTGVKDCCTEKWKYHDEAMKLIGEYND